MGTGHTHQTIRASGRLIYSPQDVTNADGDWGGTLVGHTKAFAIQSLGEQYEIEAEGLGRPSDILEADRRYACACALRGWDNDMVANLMSDGVTAVGSVTGHRLWTGPGAIVPGASSLTRAITLLFAPDDYHNVPGVLVYSAIPQLSPGVEVEWGKGVETIIPFAARAFQNSGGNAVTIGFLRDMTFPS